MTCKEDSTSLGSLFFQTKLLIFPDTWMMIVLIDANSKELRLHFERMLNEMRKVLHYAEETNENTFCLEQTGIRDSIRKMSQWYKKKSKIYSKFIQNVFHIWLASKLYSLKSYIRVISSISINKFSQKCRYYYTLMDQSVTLITVTSLFYPLTIQYWLGC